MKAASKELCPLGALRRWAHCRARAGNCRRVLCGGPFLWLLGAYMGVYGSLSTTLVAQEVQGRLEFGGMRLDKDKESHDDGDSQ